MFVVARRRSSGGLGYQAGRVSEGCGDGRRDADAGGVDCIFSCGHALGFRTLPHVRSPRRRVLPRRGLRSFFTGLWSLCQGSCPWHGGAVGRPERELDRPQWVFVEAIGFDRVGWRCRKPGSRSSRHGNGARGPDRSILSGVNRRSTENVFQVGAANRALSAKSEAVHCTSLKSNTGHLEPAAAAAALATVAVMPLGIAVFVVNAQLRLLVRKKQALRNVEHTRLNTHLFFIVSS